MLCKQISVSIYELDYTISVMKIGKTPRVTYENMDS